MFNDFFYNGLFLSMHSLNITRLLPTSMHTHAQTDTHTKLYCSYKNPVFSNKLCCIRYFHSWFTLFLLFLSLSNCIPSFLKERCLKVWTECVKFASGQQICTHWFTMCHVPAECCFWHNIHKNKLQPCSVPRAKPQRHLTNFNRPAVRAKSYFSAWYWRSQSDRTSKAVSRLLWAFKWTFYIQTTSLWSGGHTHKTSAVEMA